MTDVFRGVVIPQLVAGGLLSPAGGAQVNAIFANFSPNFFGTYNVNASGYNENELIDNQASSFKTDIALHYKPTEDSELILNSKIGLGNTMYHATNRNMLKNFSIQQHRLEYKTKNLSLRAYTSIEDAGNTHDLSALGGRIANAQPGGIQAGWAGAYLQNYFLNLFGQVNPNPLVAVNSMLGGILFYGDTSMFDRNVSPKMNYMAHAFARGEANKNMLVPGSDAFKKGIELKVHYPNLNWTKGLILFLILYKKHLSPHVLFYMESMILLFAGKVRCQAIGEIVF